MKNEQNFSDEYFMTCAIKQAQKAFDKQEVPVGAVVVCDNKIIGSGYNKKEHKECSIYHAEIVAIKNACKKKRDWLNIKSAKGRKIKFTSLWFWFV